MLRDPRLPNPPQPPEVAIRGAALVRAVNGMSTVDPRLREIRCPWCHAAPFRRCTVAGVELRQSVAHPSRYAAAGLEYPIGAAAERGAA